VYSRPIPVAVSETKLQAGVSNGRYDSSLLRYACCSASVGNVCVKGRGCCVSKGIMEGSKEGLAGCWRGRWLAPVSGGSIWYSRAQETERTKWVWLQVAKPSEALGVGLHFEDAGLLLAGVLASDKVRRR